MRRTLTLSVLLVLAPTLFAGTGRVVIINADAAGLGFNDPTPVDPVGGNTGVTVGQQRLNVVQKAALRWQTSLDTDVDIRVRMSWAPLTCDATSAVLAQAFTAWESNFQGAPRQNLWYPAALANKFAGRDLSPTTDDMTLTFNSSIGSATCFTGAGWYYGLDGNEGDGSEMYTTALHEIGHGLGSASRGLSEFSLNRPSVYDTHTLDLQAGLRWDQMSAEQRRVSLTNTGNVVWDGENVRAKSTAFLGPRPTLTVTEPSAVARDYSIGTASFGANAAVTALSGALVAALDESNTAGPSGTDGCTAYLNAAAVRDNIALVDRGTCTFVEKARRAEEAGARGLVVVNNRANTCMPNAMGGEAEEITIPVISIGSSDGAALKTELARSAVAGMLRIDPTRRAGSSTEGYVHLYTPCQVEGGSSISHWDELASPNLLMEPAINKDLPDGVDLTLYLLMDIGWTQPPRTGRRILKR